jgi:hypothetical protein
VFRQALAIAAAASFRNVHQVPVLARTHNPGLGLGASLPATIDNLFNELPPPFPVCRMVLATLLKRKLVTRGKQRGTWVLTPQGRAHSDTLVKNLDLAALTAEAAATGSMTLGGLCAPPFHRT